MNHMRSCTTRTCETFYEAANHLQHKNWVEAPKNQHIVINEEATNCTLKTTGLWLMPEPENQINTSDSLRGFWVMPSSTSDYIDHQHQEQLREQQEKLRLQEQQRLLQEQEKLRIQQEQKRLQEEQEKREQEERLMIQVNFRILL